MPLRPRLPATLRSAIALARRKYAPGPPATSTAHDGDPPFLLAAYRTGRTTMQIIPAPAKRQWMDETDHSFASRCLPLLMANQWGWFILNDRKIEVLWNGGSRILDLHIHHRKKSPAEPIDAEKLLAVSHFGHGILTWRIPFLLQTPPGWNLYVRGPANWCKDGICPLDGVVEADWSSMTFTMNWKITRMDTWVSFEEGEPICQIFPVPRGGVESFCPEIRALRDNRELETRYDAWRQSRGEFNRAPRKSGAKAPWQKHYFRGMSVLGDVFAGHQTKLAVRPFRDLGAGPAGHCSGEVSPPVCAASEGSAGAEALCERDVCGNRAATMGQCQDMPYGGTGVPGTAEVARDADEKSAGKNVRATRGVGFKIVVSSENSSYMAWQTQLFCFSALTRLGKRPTVVVHRTSGPLRPEFEIVRNWGCRVIDAPPYSTHPKGIYPPRNEPGSLLTLAAHPDFQVGHILFCEPDMLFVHRLACSGELSGEYYGYLDYNQPRVQAAARKFGITASAEELNRMSRVGVPYLIPGPLLPRIAQRWIEVLDAFEEPDWIDIMYAFGLALAVENLPIKTTHLMAVNHDPLRKLDRSVLHYCYGDDRWSKRAYLNGGSPLDARDPVPSLRGLSGTILGEILRQIRQARGCALLPPVLHRLWRFAAEISG